MSVYTVYQVGCVENVGGKLTLILSRSVTSSRNTHLPIVSYYRGCPPPLPHWYHQPALFFQCTFSLLTLVSVLPVFPCSWSCHVSRSRDVQSVDKLHRMLYERPAVRKNESHRVSSMSRELYTVLFSACHTAIY